MNNALQIAGMALSLFNMIQPILQPYEVLGVNALVAEIKSHIAAGKKMSFAEVHQMGAKHGVNMTAVYAKSGLSVAAGGVALVLAGRALRKLAA